MAKPKLSLKLIKSIVVSAEGGSITYDGIVETLDEQQASYNEKLLQGVIEQSLEKGNFIQTDGKSIVKGTFGPKPRASTGGGTPTTMYQLENPLEPSAKSKFVEKPYDKDAVEAEGSTWASTPLGAVKAAKKLFYNTVYFPQLQEYRLLEEAQKEAA